MSLTREWKTGNRAARVREYEVIHPEEWSVKPMRDEMGSEMTLE